MRALGLSLILLCTACAKKPAAKAPTSSAPSPVEHKAAEPADEEKAAPASTKKSGDPCSGGELR